MALGTYAQLKASVASWLHRTDLTTAICDFIALCEADLRRDLRCTAMEALATGTLTGETLAHPDRFLEARRLTVGGDLHEFIGADKYALLQDANVTRDVATSIGQSIYVLNGASGDPYTLIYYAAFAPFSADADTNWLLTNHPECYLYGALRHAAMYIVDDAAAQRFGGMYGAAVQAVTQQQRRAAIFGPITLKAEVVA